jgi:hypothetical protein
MFQGLVPSGVAVEALNFVSVLAHHYVGHVSLLEKPVDGPTANVLEGAGLAHANHVRLSGTEGAPGMNESLKGPPEPDMKSWASLDTGDPIQSGASLHKIADPRGISGQRDVTKVM